MAARLADTDETLLIRAADGLQAADDHFRDARGRVAGVRVDLVSEWDSASGRAMLTHLDTVDDALSRAGEALSLMADQLREYGHLAGETREQVSAAAVEAYMNPLPASTADLNAALQSFLSAEQALTDTLWSQGAAAPGGIPLPEPPPRPPRTWKTFVFGDDYPAGWYWADESGLQSSILQQPSELPEQFDPEHPVYGYDEWGRLVPAYRAAMPLPAEVIEASAGGMLLRVLALAARAARAARVTPSGARAIAPAADDLTSIVRGSYGWRPAHIDVHIREWYRLPRNARVEPWMRDEYLSMIVQAGTKQGKVFTWTLRGETGAQQTYAILRYEQSAGRWLVSQYYASGSRAGQFATAFEPTARQLARMLQQTAVR